MLDPDLVELELSIVGSYNLVQMLVNVSLRTSISFRDIAEFRVD